MLGRQHLALTAATVAAVLIPCIQYTPLVIILFTGACIGSLIPDIDAEDASIFHRNMKGLNYGAGKIFNTSIGPLLPIFGYPTKYLMYIPAIRIYNKFLPDKCQFKATHRSFTHSIIGIITLTAITGTYISIGAILTGFIAPIYIVGFMLSYMAGAFLHLLQDSCTKTGVAWKQPFSNKRLKGNLITGEDKLEPHIFLVYLITVTAASVYLTYNSSETATLLYIIPFLSLSWTAFLGIFSGVTLTQ